MGISAELSRNDNISTPSNLARLSTRLTLEVYLFAQSTDGRRSGPGLRSIYGRDPVHIALSSADARRGLINAEMRASEHESMAKQGGLITLHYRESR